MATATTELGQTPAGVGGLPFVADPSDYQPPEGLAPTELENILSDIRFQPTWRDGAAKACDYYDGNQLTAERLQKGDRLGIPPIITNLVAPVINTVLGMEAKTRTDFRVAAQDDAMETPEFLIEAMNVRLNEAERESHADRACADAYASQVKAGLGWVEVSRARDARAYPYRVSEVHRDEIWWDWRGKNPDTSDWRYLVRKRRFDVDELTAMMPEHKSLISLAVTAGFRTWQWETRDIYDPSLSHAIEVERITNIDENEWRDGERRRATLFETWYRKWHNGPVLRLPNAVVIPYNEEDPRQRAAVQAGLIQPEVSLYSEVRLAIFLGPHRLYDFPSPYSHNYFPYVPFWGFREDKSKVPYGLIRPMISPQDMVNSADARMHWMLNARRLIAHSDAIDQNANSWKQVLSELARPDAVVLLDPNKPNALFRVEQDFQLSAQQFSRRQQAAADIENTGGVFKAMMGKEGGATSGIAMQTLVEQGSVTLAEINDNYRFARRQVGEMLLSLVREDMLRKEVRVKIGKGKAKRVVVLNQRDPQTGAISNNIATVPLKVVLEEVPSTPTFRAQQLMAITEVVKSLPPEYQAAVVDIVVGLADIPNRDEVIDRVRKISGIQDSTPEEDAVQAQAAQAKQADIEQAMRDEHEAGLAETAAKTEKLRAEAAYVSAQTQELVMGPPPGQDTGLDRIK